MNGLTLLFIIFTLIFTGSTGPASHVIHEKRHLVPSGWEILRRIPPDLRIAVRVGLKQNNLEYAYNYLMDVSHPESSNYGKHWTRQQVIETFTPSDETISEVRKWLSSTGIKDSRIYHTESKGWLALVATGEEIENLLGTKYYYYRNKVNGKRAVACVEYHLPRYIQPHVDYIEPGIRLPVYNTKGTDFTKRSDIMIHGTSKHQPIAEKLDLVNLSTCDRLVTATCIKALYQISPATAAQPNNSLGIFQEGSYYSQIDLNLFFQKFFPDIPPGTHPLEAFIDGAEAPVPVGQAGIESALDLEVAYSIIYPQNITLYQANDFNYATHPTGGFLNSFLDAIDGSYCNYCAFGQCGNDPDIDPTYPDPLPGGYTGELMCGVYKPTNVISVSYGGPESNFPTYYQQRQCNEYMKLGLQGVSILFASGDNGVAGHDGCLGAEKRIFSPTFPDNCPYVTSVGGTKVYPSDMGVEIESALYHESDQTVLSSGGGFSNIFSAPDYQAETLIKYFQNNPPPYKFYEGNENFGANGGRYNRLGRGYPDVAAVGDNIAIYYKGRFGSTGGTSASTPIFASVINRIIDERLAAGKRPLGFLNPILYSNPSILNDITNGTNPGCSTDGFSAVRGWDPVTGLGSPDYPKMLEFFMNLP